LGSATPSLESFHAARTGRYRAHVMESRVAGWALPPVEIIDTRVESRENKHFVAVSRRLKTLLGQCLARQESAIIFLNRRGWATAIICPRCGFVARCERCQVAMVYHRERDAGLCHYCGAERRFGTDCPDCHFRLAHIGLGTEKVASEVARLFPEARVARLDSDVMAKRTAHASVLADFREGKFNVLVGTQIVGKGLDFPTVTLVGMVNADTALNLPDFRASERTFQLVSQVAGRAGRSERGGRVAVQTAFPEHPAVAAAARHDYLAFAERELASRQEFFWPPYCRLVRVVASSPQAIRARERAEEVAAAAGAACEELDRSIPAGERRPELLGPAPCPLEKLEDRFRWHLLVKCPLGECLGRLLPALRRAAAGAKPGARAVIDVDPVSLL
jgi:primosomal protein N' (replication factor Y)